MASSSFRRLGRAAGLSLVFTVGSFAPAMLPGGIAPEPTRSAEAAPSRRAWLGIELAAAPQGSTGVLAKRVLRSSPADKAGVKDGDVLLAIDGKDIESQRGLIDRLQEVGAGNKITLKLRRGTADKTLTVTLEEHPGETEIIKRDKVGTFAGPLKGAKSITPGTQEDIGKLKGRVVLIDFWATWCSACRAAAPALSDLSDRYGAQGLTVLGATSDKPDVAEKGAKKLGITYGVLSDVSEETMDDYAVRALPTMYLVDKNGVIRDVFVGFSDEKEIEDSLKTLLAERNP
jgi:thiol-disulfide isomerase/thioredoxin